MKSQKRRNAPLTLVASNRAVLFSLFMSPAVQLTQQLAARFMPFKIRVNALCPGLVRPPSTPPSPLRFLNSSLPPSALLHSSLLLPTFSRFPLFLFSLLPHHRSPPLAHTYSNSPTSLCSPPVPFRDDQPHRRRHGDRPLRTSHRNYPSQARRTRDRDRWALHLPELQSGRVRGWERAGRRWGKVDGEYE